MEQEEIDALVKRERYLLKRKRFYREIKHIICINFINIHITYILLIFILLNKILTVRLSFVYYGCHFIWLYFHFSYFILF